MQRRILRSFSTNFNEFFGAAVRTVAASLLVTLGLVIVLRYMGVPMPSAHELLKDVPGLSHIARVFS